MYEWKCSVAITIRVPLFLHMYSGERASYIYEVCSVLPCVLHSTDGELDIDTPESDISPVNEPSYVGVLLMIIILGAANQDKRGPVILWTENITLVATKEWSQPVHILGHRRYVTLEESSVSFNNV